MSNKKLESDISQVENKKPKYDFTNVNLATGEGVQLEFSSWEEMEEYIDAYHEARKAAGLLV